MRNITCGVRQGSILGPRLFLLYVNDMYKCISERDLKLFADDTTCTASGKYLDIDFSQMRNNISTLKK